MTNSSAETVAKAISIKYQKTNSIMSPRAKRRKLDAPGGPLRPFTDFDKIPTRTLCTLNAVFQHRWSHGRDSGRGRESWQRRGPVGYQKDLVDLVLGKGKSKCVRKVRLNKLLLTVELMVGRSDCPRKTEIADAEGPRAAGGRG